MFFVDFFLRPKTLRTFEQPLKLIINILKPFKDHWKLLKHLRNSSNMETPFSRNQSNYSWNIWTSQKTSKLAVSGHEHFPTLAGWRHHTAHLCDSIAAGAHFFTAPDGWKWGIQATHGWQGLINVQIKHKPIGDIIFNGYLKVMSKISKKQHLPTPSVYGLQISDSYLKLSIHQNQLMMISKLTHPRDIFSVSLNVNDQPAIFRIGSCENWRFVFPILVQGPTLW